MSAFKEINQSCIKPFQNTILTFLHWIITSLLSICTRVLLTEWLSWTAQKVQWKEQPWTWKSLPCLMWKSAEVLCWLLRCVWWSPVPPTVYFKWTFYVILGIIAKNISLVAIMSESTWRPHVMKLRKFECSQSLDGETMCTDGFHDERKAGDIHVCVYI